MARSLISGLLKQGHQPEAIAATARSADKRIALAQTFGVLVTDDNRVAAERAETVVLASKPQQLALLCSQLTPLSFHNKLLISVAAGVSTASLAARLTGAEAIVRAMPNTPSAIGLGVTGLYATAAVSPAQKARAEALFRAVGEVVWLSDETQMNSVTAVAGSGPAYYFLFMEAMQAAAEQLGLDPAAAELLVKQTALGAVSLALQSPEELRELRRQVTSPGGTTAAALDTLQAGGFEQLIAQALRAATDRGAELAKLLEQPV